MKVYHLGHMANQYQWLRPSSAADMELLNQLAQGTPIGAQWSPAEVVLLRESERFEELLPSDFPCLLGPPVFSSRAVTILRDLLESGGEFLPLRSKDGELYAYNITNVIDALDLTASDVKFMSDGIRVVSIQRYGFQRDKLVGAAIFRIPQVLRSRVFVTDEFVQRVESHSLTGFRFEPLWSGE